MSKSSLLDRLAQPRSLAAILAAIMAFVAITAIPAEARRHRHHGRHHYHRHHFYRHHARHYFHRNYSESDSAGRHHGFAAIVIDANSGRELWGSAEHELRHPASVTKVMTLYLLFEQLEQGRLRLNSPLMISEHATEQAPSKLGLDAGDTISVENAIKAVVTKSANDIAVAIAENIGGDEETFARMMNRKARALGMRNTHYENASGLPNSEQVTTAYDLAILGRAIQDRFPRYYRYFSTHSFAYNGSVMRNHNHLLGRVEGMDGIKTGYTRASGFNLLTNVKRDGHHIVAVVLGGKTAGHRDRIMASLIADHIDDGATVRTARAITEDGGEENIQVASADDEDARRQAAAERRAAERAERAERERVAAEERAERETEQRAEREAEQQQRRAQQQRLAFADVDQDATASVDEEEEPREQRRASRAPTPPVRVAAAAPLPPAPIQRPDKADKARPAFVSGIQKFLDQDEKKAKPGKKAVADGSTSKTTTTQIAVSGATPSSVRSSAKVELVRPKNAGWMIQIGAAEDPDKANQLLSRARSQLRGMPSTAHAFTEKVQKGNTTLYRARFAGLEERSAKSACDALKSSGFACFPTKN